MGKRLSAWWAAYGPTKRRLIQVYAALLYNAHAKGFIQGDIYTGPIKNLCVPGLNCYSCPGAIGACPLGALQNALAATGSRAPWYVLGILLLFGLTLGRTICGWLCPMGLIQELLHKIPTPKLKKSRITRALSYLKYGVLIVFALALPLIYAARRVPLPAFCKYICPAGTLEGGIPHVLLNPQLRKVAGVLFDWKLLVLLFIVLASTIVHRPFCRYLCPLGAFYSLFNRFSFFQMHVDRSKCVGCRVCERVCPMAVEVIKNCNSAECIRCGKCKTVCPTGAISWGFTGNVTAAGVKAVDTADKV